MGTEARLDKLQLDEVMRGVCAVPFLMISSSSAGESTRVISPEIEAQLVMTRVECRPEMVVDWMVIFPNTSTVPVTMIVPL